MQLVRRPAQNPARIPARRSQLERQACVMLAWLEKAPCEQDRGNAGVEIEYHVEVRQLPCLSPNLAGRCFHAEADVDSLNVPGGITLQGGRKGRRAGGHPPHTVIRPASLNR